MSASQIEVGKREHEQWVQRMREEYAAEAEARQAAESEKERQRQKTLDIPVGYGHRPVAGELFGVSFEAITTPRGLMAEGHRMHHCIGASQFRDALRRGRAFYYHLSEGKDQSTLELQRIKGADRIGQHCGYCNQRPTTRLELAARELAKQINDAETALKERPPA